MNCCIKEYTQYQEDEILHLYASVGWINYTDNPEMLENAYRHSLKILGAYADDRLVGIIRAVGDGYSVVYIQDILVLPEYQRQGIGTELMKEMLKIYQHVYQKVLLTDNTDKTILFYQSLGFMMDTDVDCRAFFRNY